MNPNTPRRPRLTRDDSRALDGVLPPTEAARVAREQSADPARAHAVAAYREAADLWADDARRAAQHLDTALLVERVLARGGAPPVAAPGSAPWGYTAAAVALIALGLAGLWSTRGVSTPARTDVSDLEPGRLAVLRRLELDELRAGGR